MKREIILIAAFSFVSILTAAQAANAQGRKQGTSFEMLSSSHVICPAEWREERFSATAAPMADTEALGDQAFNQGMIPAQWREERFSATATPMANTKALGDEALNQHMIPAQWREDRLSEMPMPIAYTEGLVNQVSRLDMDPAQWRGVRHSVMTSFAWIEDRAHSKQTRCLALGKC